MSRKIRYCVHDPLRFFFEKTIVESMMEGNSSRIWMTTGRDGLVMTVVS